MFSCGPTITPARAARTRPGIAASAARSHAALSGPYSRSSLSKTGESSVTSASPDSGYTDPEETKP